MSGTARLPKIRLNSCSPKGAYPSPFTATNKAWGYVDIISTTWDDFFKDSPYNAQGSIEVKV